jgi:hypothetical protein
MRNMANLRESKNRLGILEVQVKAQLETTQSDRGNLQIGHTLTRSDLKEFRKIKLTQGNFQAEDYTLEGILGPYKLLHQEEPDQKELRMRFSLPL